MIKCHLLQCFAFLLILILVTFLFFSVFFLTRKTKKVWHIFQCFSRQNFFLMALVPVCCTYRFPLTTQKLVSRVYSFLRLPRIVSRGTVNLTKDISMYRFSMWSIDEWRIHKDLPHMYLSSPRSLRFELFKSPQTFCKRYSSKRQDTQQRRVQNKSIYYKNYRNINVDTYFSCLCGNGTSKISLTDEMRNQWNCKVKNLCLRVNSLLYKLRPFCLLSQSI